MKMDSEDEDLEYDWEQLKTITTFDGISNASSFPFSFPNASTQLVNNGVLDKVTAKASTPVSLLVESLVQQLCTMLEADPQRSLNLYNTICERLHAMNLIDETYAMGEFEMMRSQYQRALYQLVSIARGQDLPVSLQTVWPLTQPIGLEWSRYHREFVELSYIAGGGFGKVFRSKNNFDGIEYAVKKITIKSTTINNVLLHLAEVKTLASLNHVNIVPYKAAWLEPLLADHNESVEGSKIFLDDESDSESMLSSMKSTQNDSLVNKTDETSDFIQFEDSQADENQSENNKVAEINDKNVNYEETQPHLKLKWAMLYIQMTLCQLTLREWLDERNKHSDFNQFYAKFTQNRHSTTVTRNSFYQKSVHLSSSNATASCRVENGKIEEKSVSNHADHMEVVTDIFSQLLNGLNYIHSRGIVHHDIKPSNIFVSFEDNNRLTIQLGDFGLACPLQSAHSGAGFGTPLYAAPEQLEGRCDPKSDIYSLGIILLELLLSFSTDMERADLIKNVRKGVLPQDLDINFSNLIKSLLHMRPAKRPDTHQLSEAIKCMQFTKDKVIVELQHRLSVREEEIESLKLLIDECSYSSLQVELRSKTTEILRKEQELKTKTEEVETKLEELRYKDVVLQTQLISLEKRDMEIKIRDEEILRLKRMLQTYQTKDTNS